jgi:PIN domain nuclease of toxin-antitoxin system
MGGAVEQKRSGYVSEAAAVKKYLLDTCVFLWAVREPKRLSRHAKRALESNAQLLLSPASAWEIIAKSEKLKLYGVASNWIDTNRRSLMLDWLPIYGEHMLQLESLPPVHYDPFDRILIAQAIHEGVTLITPDEHIQGYPVEAFW